MKVDHIGIATRQIDEALALWRDVLGLEIDSTEEVAEQGVRVAMLPIGESHIELLEPLSAETPVGKFLREAWSWHSPRCHQGNGYSSLAGPTEGEGDSFD